MLYVLKQQGKLRARRALLNSQFLLQGFGLFLGFCGGPLGLFQFSTVSFLLCSFCGLAGLVCGFCFTPYRAYFRVPLGLADFLGGGLFGFPPGGLESFFLFGFGFFQCLAVLFPQGFQVCRRFGFGFRAGFLGLLHMDIVQERLEREYNMDLITTAPSVVYEVLMTDGEVVQVENPSKLPPVDKIDEIREPIDTVTIFVPNEYVGAVMKLCQDKRGVQTNLAYHGRQVHLTYDLPLAEIVLDFFDRMKSLTRGYASMDYEFKEYRAADVVRVDILINGDKVDPLSAIMHRSNAVFRGRELVQRLRTLIPRQMYEVSIQAAIGANIIARENVKALRKNVLAKCYGGDITRKRKLLEKQKAGKKRMKQVGSVEIPQEAFLAILEVDEK